MVCPKHKLAAIEKQSSDLGVTHEPLGNPKDNLLLPLEANGGVQRGVTLLAHWGVFSGACTALRKCPNELWLFYPQKPAVVSALIGSPFFADTICFHQSAGRTVG